MSPARQLVALSFSLVACGASVALAQRSPARATRPASTAGPTSLPLKYAGKPTTAEINAADLMTRLYQFADDSMMGREVGTEYHLKATSYIEHEVRRLGLVPAGDSGTYFQNLPVYTSYPDSTSTMRVNGTALVWGTDFMPASNAERRIALDGQPVLYAGSVADSSTWISAEQATGHVVLLHVPPTSSAFIQNAGLRSRLSKAAAILVASWDNVPASVRPFIVHGQQQRVRDGAPAPGASLVYVTRRVEAQLFGAQMDSVKSGTASQPIAGTIILHRAQAPARNVVAILPGSDPRLKGEYVAIGAHNDHIGFSNRPEDHDSLRAFNIVARPSGADSPTPLHLDASQQARFRTMLDSLRKLRPARMDSISNGADDDGSGTVSVLEIAEAFAKAKVRPKRSILFVWHAGEEKGLWGSEYFTDHPTVPRDSIVAQLNMDMVGRGAASDVTGESKTGAPLHGGKGYLQLVGSRRLSTELGDLMDSVNTRGKFGFNFDYAMDANGHPQVIYCRSDHYEYARYGIPIVFMTTGGHADYHQVTDEPQYIDYVHMAQVAKFVQAAATTVANLDHRVVVDKPKPDPKGSCVQ